METVGLANRFLDFGTVITALKEGRRARRRHWNTSFIFRQVPSTVPGEYVEKMTSLPDSVKSWYEKLENKPELTYSNQIAEADAYGNIIGWSPSVEDVFAEDWIVMKD